MPEQDSSTPAPPFSSKVVGEDDVGVGEQGNDNDKPGPSPSKTCEETGPKDESLLSSSPSLKMKTYRLTSSGVMVPEFLEDQARESNFTDLDMICCDGYIQVVCRVPKPCIYLAIKFIVDTCINNLLVR